MLEVKNLTLGYDTPLLKDITFSAQSGQVIGILGRNGCGKTTLLRGLAGSIRRFSGEVWVDGRNCTAMSPRVQAKYRGVLAQHTQIMEGILAREILEMGRYPHSSAFRDLDREGAKKIEECARLLGISHLLDHDCGKLSQGQRQLVLLGRLMVQDTPLMLLDEPNSALDYDNSHTMFAIVRRLVRQQSKTALVVLHDPELALRYCDRLLLLKDGTICQDLAPGEAGEEAITAALGQLYPNVIVRRDPFDGHFRCYSKERSLC